jgi:rhodanese-related sulfurtransferase
MGLLKKLFGKKETLVVEERITPPPPPEPEPIEVREVTAHELGNLLELDGPVTVVDLRQAWEYNSGRIPGAINVPMMELPARLKDLPKEGHLIMQCYHGYTSLDASAYLIQNGWQADQVSSLAGGMSGWVASQGIESLERDME